MLRITSILLLFLFLTFIASNLTAQEEIITSETVQQVELLAEVGWFDDLHILSTQTNPVDQNSTPLWQPWVIAS